MAVSPRVLTLVLQGDIIDVQLPTNATGRPHENRVSACCEKKTVQSLTH
jgi:hypothetical protein